MGPEAPEPPVMPEELTAAASRGDWESVNRLLAGQHADEAAVVATGHQHLGDEDPNLRSLAVRIYAASTREIINRNKDAISRMMEHDEDPDVRFYATYALFRHGDRSPRIIHELRRYIEDENNGPIAQASIRLFEREQSGEK